MSWTVWATVVAAASAEAVNLLLNPGFDGVNDRGQPKRWDRFVQPMDGAMAQLDGDAFSGAYSAVIHNPDLYDSEPANNWSQVIVGNFEGSTLKAEAWARSEDASEAAIWLQCFSSQPLRLLGSATSSAETPLRGTANWTPLEASIEVPRGTRFLVLRCVLLGRGTVWFDDLRLWETRPDETPKKNFSIQEIEPLDDGEFNDAEVEDILNATASVQSAIRDLQSTNATLQQQIAEMQAELTTYRSSLADSWNKVVPLEDSPVRHPLVPVERVPSRKP